MGLLETSSSSLLLSSTVSVGCGRYSLTISSAENDLDALVATSLLKSSSPSASRFSRAMSGLASQSWFRTNSNLSTALLSSPSSTIPLNRSSWSSVVPFWAFNEIPDFWRQFRIACSVTSPLAFLSIIMASRIDVRTSCLSLPTAPMILYITRDWYLAWSLFKDLRLKKWKKHIKPLHLELLDVFLKYCQGKNELKHIFQW